ncbi:hypothetical protein LPMP_310760 [Leishmania panamensis]|uniref:BAR domain-containing protein n=1 Tax=Leishmania panamensis TaxID=5679 RepID=A0A088RZI0_LEIPA|nr:hypothetical protein LPMP_310760 [Leishmania panamensis]AIO00665.1 hypothetical protein LPMP_310760 [Leishmania panamensis]
MSMQHDFIHPRQLDDVRAIHAAIQSFSSDMAKMMLLMKELGTTLEQVSHSFDALTSLSFSTPEVKKYVHHFAEEVLHMKEGIAFRNYNKLVHEEVLFPVERLKTSLKETEKAAKAEKSAFDRYKKAKLLVDKQEKSYAEKSKALDTSKSYPTHVQARNQSLASLQRSKNEFEDKFVTLVSEVEKVTATALKRYLHLNAGYMTSVVDALTKTDPTVEEAVALYRQEQEQQRLSAIKQRCAQVNSELDASYASQGYRLGPNGRNDNPHDSSNKQEPSRNSRKPHQLPIRVSPNQPPLPSESSPAMPLASTASASPNRGTSVAKMETSKPTAVAVSTTTTPAASAASLPVENAGLLRRNADVSIDDEDFGSISQVGSAGRVAPPLYSLSRGPQSQVSSAPPQPGYTAVLNTTLLAEFMTRMEAKSITSSEVCVPPQKQK